MHQPSFKSFRIAILLFAGILGMQCVWLLLAELSRPGAGSSLTDSRPTAIDARQRSDATWAARIGAIRGDLWAQSAFTFSDLLWTSPSKGPELSRSLDEVHERLDRALRYAPNQAASWLLLAGLASRYRWSTPDEHEALRMSYYTGPSERSLLPVRVSIAAEMDEPGDSELQELARRDLRFFIATKGKDAIAKTYQSASAAGKMFIEKTLRESDPGLANSLRLGPQ